mmetsp:Transcript_1581/g.3329  ORF Transcript_1581/g.3329 Transcript_1581/m.3329 type:complete len:485 (-) Transcript_1581:872-2326(-)
MLCTEDPKVLNNTMTVSGFSTEVAEDNDSEPPVLIPLKRKSSDTSVTSTCSKRSNSDQSVCFDSIPHPLNSSATLLRWQMGSSLADLPSSYPPSSMPPPPKFFSTKIIDENDSKPPALKPPKRKSFDTSITSTSSKRSNSDQMACFRSNSLPLNSSTTLLLSQMRSSSANMPSTYSPSTVVPPPKQGSFSISPKIHQLQKQKEKSEDLKFYYLQQQQHQQQKHFHQQQHYQQQYKIQQQQQCTSSPNVKQSFSDQLAYSRSNSFPLDFSTRSSESQTLSSSTHPSPIKPTSTKEASSFFSKSQPARQQLQGGSQQKLVYFHNFSYLHYHQQQSHQLQQHQHQHQHQHKLIQQQEKQHDHLQHQQHFSSVSLHPIAHASSSSSLPSSSLLPMQKQYTFSQPNQQTMSFHQMLMGQNIPLSSAREYQPQPTKKSCSSPVFLLDKQGSDTSKSGNKPEKKDFRESPNDNRSLLKALSSWKSIKSQED